MNADPLSNRRRSIRLPKHDYSSHGAYFVSLCTHNRERLFGEVIDDEMRPNELGRIVQTAREGLARHYPDVELDAFVVMPNHVHGIVVILANGVAEANPIGRDDRDGFVGAIHELPVRARSVGAYENRREADRANQGPRRSVRAAGKCCWGRSSAGSR
jgi:hypothetical protein